MEFLQEKWWAPYLYAKVPLDLILGLQDMGKTKMLHTGPSQKNSALSAVTGKMTGHMLHVYKLIACH